MNKYTTKTSLFDSNKLDLLITKKEYDELIKNLNLFTKNGKDTIGTDEALENGYVINADRDINYTYKIVISESKGKQGFLTEKGQNFVLEEIKKRKEK